jgi:4-oxalocrotonate tautomerase
MPIIQIKVSAPKSRVTTRRIADHLLEVTSKVLNKKPEVTAIAIEYVDPEDWIIAGKPLSESGLASFYFDIRITDETNTKAEKAQYIREAFHGLERILGPLHPESYIHVHDVRAAAYGFGGKTQEHRFQHNG